MRPLSHLTLGLSLVSLTTAAACNSGKPTEAPPATVPAATTPAAAPTVATPPPLDLAAVRSTFKPLPPRFDSPSYPATPDKIALGRMLYFDPRLSKSQTLSCNSCHQLDRGGVDGERFSKGHKGQLGGRNAPTVFNAAGHIAQFWDGRAADVEEQAKGPVLNPVEMAMADANHVIAVLRSMPGYVKAFQAAFPGEKEPITYDNFGRAVGAFERGLVTPGRFDALLAGRDDALDAGEKAGLALFVATGCAGCHSGALVGGGLYMKLGVVNAYDNAKDVGRAAITRSDADRMFFKVPSLRNVADTAPYFHDGAMPDLPTAVRTMARLQLGKQLTDDEVGSIVRFLKTLSGKPPAAYVEKPALPAAGPKTPKPDLT